MGWKSDYRSKLVTAEVAAQQIKSGDKIWMTPAAAAPIDILVELIDRMEELEDVRICSGLSLYPYEFLSDYANRKHISYGSYFYGGAEHLYIPQKTVDVNSINLSIAYKALWFYEGIDTLVAEVSPPDDDGFMSYGVVGGMVGDDMRQVAKKVILQVNEMQLPVKGERMHIHVSDADFIVEGDHPMEAMATGTPTEIEAAIADHIVERIPDGATLASGIGGLANAVAMGLTNAKNISVHSEMFNDALIELYKKGVLTDDILCSFSLGSQELYEFDSKGPVRFAPVTDVNNRMRLMSLRDFVSVNSCLMVDLTGQVCSESIGFRQYSSTGGQLDFAMACNLAHDQRAQNYLCMASTNTSSDGTVSSNVKVALPPGAAVSIPRSEIMYVATEYGIADLRWKTIPDRVKEMISIAHPDFRDDLEREAREVGLIGG